MIGSRPLTLPNFLVIGSSRAGTTSLYHYLKQHPAVYVPPVLEPRFFAFEGDPLNYRGPGDELLRERVVTRLEDYAALFDNVRKEVALGEVSPAYLSVASAADRIRHYIPDARLIAILRNPVERAISSFRLEVLEGFETLALLEDAIEAEEQRLLDHWAYPWGYRPRGFYYAQLKRYFERFPREQIRVFLYEDWSAGDAALMSEVYRFLGVDDSNVLAPAERQNSTDPSRFAARQRVRPVVSEEIRTRLLAEYREDIQRLQELIDRDLSTWL